MGWGAGKGAVFFTAEHAEKLLARLRCYRGAIHFTAENAELSGAAMNPDTIFHAENAGLSRRAMYRGKIEKILFIFTTVYFAREDSSAFSAFSAVKKSRQR